MSRSHCDECHYLLDDPDDRCLICQPQTPSEEVDAEEWIKSRHPGSGCPLCEAEIGVRE